MLKRLSIVSFVLFVCVQSFALAASVGTNLIIGEKPDICLGKNDAPVTIIAYSSLTCAFCADFHLHTLPELQSKYIDHGKVRFVFRHFPVDSEAMKAAMIVTSFPPERRHDLLTKIFAKQDAWLSHKPSTSIAELASISADEFNRRIKDKQLEQIVLQQTLTGQKNFSVNATPTFFVNGKLFEGAPTYKELTEMLAEHNVHPQS